ncbi:MAG: hypothetical protein R3B95_19805 [Nitrospirales bacterium]|nr:hypothetical protein [Nitrospirales bacterium]
MKTSKKDEKLDETWKIRITKELKAALEASAKRFRRTEAEEARLLLEIMMGLETDEQILQAYRKPPWKDRHPAKHSSDSH